MQEAVKKINAIVIPGETIHIYDVPNVFTKSLVPSTPFRMWLTPFICLSITSPFLPRHTTPYTLLETVYHVLQSSCRTLPKFCKDALPMLSYAIQSPG